MMTNQNEIPDFIMTDTGSIKSRQTLKDYAGMFPNKNCKKCYGRGWTGKLILQNDPQNRKIHILCKCVKQDSKSLYCGIKW